MTLLGMKSDKVFLSMCVRVSFSKWVSTFTCVMQLASSSICSCALLSAVSIFELQRRSKLRSMCFLVIRTCFKGCQPCSACKPKAPSACKFQLQVLRLLSRAADQGC